MTIVNKITVGLSCFNILKDKIEKNNCIQKRFIIFKKSYRFT